VLAETGISVSLGVATSPLLAKMASEAAKQRQDHVCIVPSGQEAGFLDPLPVRALVGVGPKAEARLLEAGITTIGVLAAHPVDDLITLFGRAYGRYLHEASRGIDGTRLEPERVAKSISAEHTFPRDTVDRHALWQQLRAQADEVAARLRAEHRVPVWGLADADAPNAVQCADGRPRRAGRRGGDAHAATLGADAGRAAHWVAGGPAHGGEPRNAAQASV
jgi:nucleotidyltransferase/DNA polymerase involved in DNA repair